MRHSEKLYPKENPAITLINKIKMKTIKPPIHLKENAPASPDSHPEFLFTMLNPSETQTSWWITSKESWKTTSFGPKKPKKMTLDSLINSKTFKLPNTSGSDAQTQEFQPTKSSALSQENFSFTETSPTKRHCQISTLWQLFNTLLNTWKLRTLSYVVITDVVASERHSREKTTDLWSHGFHTSEIWGPVTENNSEKIIKRRTKIFWWNWT